MGQYLFDQFTFLHFSMGAVFYFFGFKLITFVILHILFEITENSVFGISLINNYFKFWPGGKPSKDTLTNIIGDNIGAILGWLAAYYIDSVGSKLGYYDSHISNKNMFY